MVIWKLQQEFYNGQRGSFESTLHHSAQTMPAWRKGLLEKVFLELLLDWRKRHQLFKLELDSLSSSLLNTRRRGKREDATQEDVCHFLQIDDECFFNNFITSNVT